MKKIFSIITAITILFAVIATPIISFAAGTTYSGTCGENLTWTLDSRTGLLNISGTGAMSDYFFEDPAPWGSLRATIETLVIDDGVTSIGDHAFEYCSSLTSITIPDSVTSIGYSVFFRCSSLTSITIPDSVTSIGDSTFYECSSLTSITIPDSVTSIGDSTFYECSSLKYNTYDNAKYLGNSSNPYIVLVTANSTSITNCNIHKDTKFIHSNAFSGCSSLTSITIPDSVTSIGGSAFDGCSSLTSITIGNGVTSIGGYAFSGCDRLKYNIYDNAKYLGNSSNPYIVLVTANSTSITSCNIHKDTKYIYRSAFYKCSSLTSTTIPDGVTSIGDYAFQYCSSLTSITIHDSVTSIGGSVFSGCDRLKYNTYDNAKYLGNSSNPYVVLISANDTSITSCNIHKDTKHICTDAFYDCGYLTSIIIPGSVTSIGYWAFSFCSSLTSITIPDSVISIGDDAFSGCDNVTLHVKENSYAHRYAVENELKYDFDRSLYPDVVDSTAWYYAPIEYVSNNNIFSGYSNGYFGLSDNIQRQDFMITLAKYSKENYGVYSGKGKFSDVDSSGYYATAVNWGVSKGIVSGYQNGTFGVGDNVTREQLVLFFYRYAKYIGAYTSVTTNATYWRNKYSDFDSVSDWAQDAVIWALEKGIISGKQGLYIDPQGNAERCQVAVIFYNIDNNHVFG